MKRLLILLVPGLAHADVAPDSSDTVATGAFILIVLGLLIGGAIWLGKRKR